MKIHYLQHVPFENPGSILDWATSKKHTVTYTKLYENTDFPEMDEFEWLIIMGGPMNIYEEHRYPWLALEKIFIGRAIKENKVVLGLCLGAQLIADVIGGRVIPNQYKEIGWFKVKLLDGVATPYELSFLPKEPIVFEWHGDTFVDLPEEARLLATNDACKNQAFLYKERVYGFQFHFENTRTIIESLIEHCREDMETGPYVQSAEELLAGSCYMDQNNRWMDLFLTSLEEKWKQFNE